MRSNSRRVGVTRVMGQRESTMDSTFFLVIRAQSLIAEAYRNRTINLGILDYLLLTVQPEDFEPDGFLLVDKAEMQECEDAAPPAQPVIYHNENSNLSQ
jgi:hypothetical protein